MRTRSQRFLVAGKKKIQATPPRPTGLELLVILLIGLQAFAVGASSAREFTFLTSCVLALSVLALLRPGSLPMIAWLMRLRTGSSTWSAQLFGWTVLASVFSSAVSFWAAWVTTLIDPQSAADDYNFFAEHLFANDWLMLSGIVNTPIVEEVLFRGFLFVWLNEKMGIHKAILLSSLLFGILHLEMVGSTLFGVVMCLAFVQSGSIVLPMALHFLNNAIVFAYAWTLPAAEVTATAENVMALSFTENSLVIAGVVVVASSPSLFWIVRSLRKPRLN